MCGCSFPHLRVLDVSHNELIGFSDAVVGELPVSLTALNLEHNGLEAVPASLARLTRLMDLNVGFNLLQGVRPRNHDTPAHTHTRTHAHTHNNTH